MKNIQKLKFMKHQKYNIVNNQFTFPQKMPKRKISKSNFKTLFISHNNLRNNQINKINNLIKNKNNQILKVSFPQIKTKTFKNFLASLNKLNQSKTKEKL